MPDNNEATIKELIDLLKKGNAHVSFEEAVKRVSPGNAGKKTADLPYSIWMLVEHIRITQWDILEFSRNSSHISPEWPNGYWPVEDAPKHEQEWQRSLHEITRHRDEFIDLLLNKHQDIYKPFPWGDGQSLFREALLVADHTSYHTGQIVLLRRLLDDWV